MAVDAEPYRGGKGWPIRLRYKGNDIYLSGRKTAAEATKDANAEATRLMSISIKSMIDTAGMARPGAPAIVWAGPPGMRAGTTMGLAPPIIAVH